MKFTNEEAAAHAASGEAHKRASGTPYVFVALSCGARRAIVLGEVKGVDGRGMLVRLEGQDSAFWLENTTKEEGKMREATQAEDIGATGKLPSRFQIGDVVMVTRDVGLMYREPLHANTKAQIVGVRFVAGKVSYEVAPIIGERRGAQQRTHERRQINDGPPLGQSTRVDSDDVEPLP